MDNDNKILNNSVVICQVDNCNMHIGFSKNTTNLSLHLKRHHPTQHSEIHAVSSDNNSGQAHCSSTSSHWQPRITDSFYLVQPYWKTNPSYKACEQALAKFVCLDLQPLSIVSSLPFLQLLKTLDPKFTPLSASQFSRVVIPSLYKPIKCKVKDSVGKADYIRN